MSEGVIPNVLSIAGSDPSGGAGMQADLKVFSALGCYGMAVPSALTVQNTHGVIKASGVPAALIEEQLCAIFDDIEVAGVKIGIVGAPETIEVIANVIKKYNPVHVVFDPVMASSGGTSFGTDETVKAMKAYLIPLCSVITPNVPEAEDLLGYTIEDLKSGAQDLLSLGAKAALLKGGHWDESDIVIDVLAYEGGIEAIDGPRVHTKNTHGTGCALSSALACALAQGLDVVDAARVAKMFVTSALQAADDLNVGSGTGPIQHFFRGGA